MTKSAAETTAAALEAARTAAAPEPEVVKKLKPMERSAMAFLELQNTAWTIVGPRDADPQDLERDPGLWSAVSSDLKYLDHVWVTDPDRRWRAEFMIVDCRPGFVLAKVLRSISLPPREGGPETRLPDGYRLVRSDVGELDGWAVLRLSDGRRLLSSGGTPFRRQEDAIRHVLDSAALRGSGGPLYTPGR